MLLQVDVTTTPTINDKNDESALILKGASAALYIIIFIICNIVILFCY
jgi:hypothetical protein